MMTIILALLTVGLLVGVASVFGGTVVWLLWGHVMPMLFGLPDITWTQSVALVWICSILLKSSSTSKNEKD